MVQDAAKAKEAAKRAREAEVFILNPQGPPTTHTVPKPFKLHETTNQVTILYTGFSKVLKYQYIWSPMPHGSAVQLAVTCFQQSNS